MECQHRNAAILRGVATALLETIAHGHRPPYSALEQRFGRIGSVRNRRGYAGRSYFADALDTDRAGVLVVPSTKTSYPEKFFDTKAPEKGLGFRVIEQGLADPCDYAPVIWLAAVFGAWLCS